MDKSEQLTGVALRRALAESLGWEWMEHEAIEPCAVNEHRQLVLRRLDWNEVMSAAAGLLDRYKLRIGKGRIKWTAIFSSSGDFHEDDVVGYGDGESGPEALARTIVATLEARRGQA